MPATLVVTYEKQPYLAARTAPVLLSLPARLRQARTHGDLGSALENAFFPVSLISAVDAGDELPHLVSMTLRHRGFPVVLGPSPAFDMLDCWDMGAVFVTSSIPGRPAWDLLVERLVAQAQDRLTFTG